jgi:hypothetical protein
MSKRTQTLRWFLKWLQLSSLLLLLSIRGQAQAPELGLWTGVNLEKRLSRSFALHLNGQLRYSENVTVRRAMLGEVGLSYKLVKHLELTGYYRYTARRKFDEDTYAYSYKPYHRFYADLSYDRKVGPFKLDYRLRYQNQFKDDVSGLETDKSCLRNKLELAWPNASRFTPYVSTDIFYRLGEGFDQLRNKVGVSIEVTRHQKLDLFGFTDYQLIDRQKNQLLLGVTYRVKF